MRSTWLMAAAAAIFVQITPTGGSHAEEASFAVGELKVVGPWARETTASAKAGGGFMTIINAGTEPDRLIAAASDQARRVELHTHKLDGDVMRMREVEGGIEIPAQGMAALAPGGFHVMLMGLNTQLAEGESFPLTLEFERAGSLTVDVAIKDIKHQGHSGHAQGHSHSN